MADIIQITNFFFQRTRIQSSVAPKGNDGEKETQFPILWSSCVSENIMDGSAIERTA